MKNRQILPALRTVRCEKADPPRGNEIRHELLTCAELLQLAASACRLDPRKEHVLTASDLTEAARQSIKHAIDHVSDADLTDVRLGLLRLHSLLQVVQGALTRGHTAGAVAVADIPLADTLEIGVELTYSLIGRLATLTRESVCPAQTAA